MEGKELYFAFASNLSERKMKERGAKFTSRGSAVLRGYRFVFNTNWTDDGFGYANITPDDNEILEGEDLLPKEYAAYLRNLKG